MTREMQWPGLAKWRDTGPGLAAWRDTGPDLAGEMQGPGSA